MARVYASAGDWLPSISLSEPSPFHSSQLADVGPRAHAGICSSTLDPATSAVNGEDGAGLPIATTNVAGAAGASTLKTSSAGNEKLHSPIPVLP